MDSILSSAAKIRKIANASLAALDAEFAKLYAADGRPSIAPERLLRAALIQIPFSIRSERQLMEQMQYNLLFRWFVGLGIDDPAWVATVFTKNRDRLLNTHIARKFLGAILAHKDVAPLLSDEHFSVDGTLIEAWASMKSFQPKPDGAEPPSGESGSGGRRAKSAGEGRNAEAKAYAQKQLGAVDAIDILARPMHRGAGYRLADMVQHVGFA
jgi:transposase